MPITVLISADCVTDDSLTLLATYEWPHSEMLIRRTQLSSDDFQLTNFEVTPTEYTINGLTKLINTVST